ncbi:hypothetical protein BASA83_013046 [Batrachochytrium salamandrivorans]|nr:hypothetical protein BASA83_013046 [Batrachochytrium salamandrivorans]
MKLISFAVISLLAITVSAQVLPGTSSVEYTLQHGQYDVDEKNTDRTFKKLKVKAKVDSLVQGVDIVRTEVEGTRVDIDTVVEGADSEMCSVKEYLKAVASSSAIIMSKLEAARVLLRTEPEQQASVAARFQKHQAATRSQILSACRTP